MEFQLDTVFAHADNFIIDLKLCRVILHDNKLFPWVILIPRKNNIKELVDLSVSERHQLMDEIALLEKVFLDVFKPFKLNVASLGNITSQLHVHIIARYTEDSAWPAPTFGKEEVKYSDDERHLMIMKIKKGLADLG